MKQKKIVSALPALYPVSIVETKTGVILSPEDHDEILTRLVRFVQEEAISYYAKNKERVEENIAQAQRIFNPAEFARQHGYSLEPGTLPAIVTAKSRIERLFRHKLVSEVTAHVRNPNPRKQALSFGSHINLGAIDNHFASMSLEDNRLFLLIKPWDKELLLEFAIPDYVLARNIHKWSLPVIHLNRHGITYRFSITETPMTIPTPSHHRAGVDLGRATPYVMAITNTGGARVAHYFAPGRVRALNAKRERLLREKKHTLKKARAIEALGLDPTILYQETTRLAHKIKILGTEVARQTAASITTQVAKHKINTLAVEDLRWVTGSKYGSRWAHGKTQASITHALAREGTLTKRVNPKNTSRTCAKCANPVTTSNNRTVLCAHCKTKLDRDINAALNIANKLPRRPEPKRKLRDNHSPSRQVITTPGSDSKTLITILVT